MKTRTANTLDRNMDTNYTTIALILIHTEHHKHRAKHSYDLVIRLDLVYSTF